MKKTLSILHISLDSFLCIIGHCPFVLILVVQWDFSFLVMSKAIKNNNTVNNNKARNKTNNKQQFKTVNRNCDRRLQTKNSLKVAEVSATRVLYFIWMHASFWSSSIRHSPTGSNLCHKIQANMYRKKFPLPLSTKKYIICVPILIEVSGSVRSSRGKQQNWNTLLEVKSSCTRRFAHNCAKGKICTRQSTKSFITSKLKISKEPCTSKVLAMWYHLLRRGNRRFPLIARVSHHHRAHRLW